MISTFGPAAIVYGRRLPDDLNAVICDGTAAPEALAAAVRERRAGRPVFVMPMLSESRAAVARSVAISVLKQIGDPDGLRSAFENIARGTLGLNGSPISGMSFYDSNVLNTLSELVHVGDALIVRSQLERYRLAQMLNIRMKYVAVAPLLDPDVPVFRPDADADRVVVWAPNLNSEQIAMYAYALAQLRRAAIFVCNGSIGGIHAEFVSPAAALTALRRAALVIDTSLDDPGTALAFARRGVPVAAAVTTGVEEWIDGVFTYDAVNFASILAVATRGRAGRLQTVDVPERIPQRLRATLESTRPIIPDHGPLISVVVPTYNRRALLPRCLRLLAAQTYTNLEVIVVNDGGDAVDDIVAEYPFARLIEMPENTGGVAAVNAGVAAARGEYTALIPDDDLYYPDHFARLAQAAVASDADVIHSNRMVRLVHLTDAGEEETFGHRLTHFGSLDPLETLWACVISHQALIARTALFIASGSLDARWRRTGDYELIIRFAKLTDFVHVDTVSAEMVVRDDRKSIGQSDGEGSAGELAAMLAEHLPPGRAMIAERQRTTVEGQRQHHAESATFFSAFMHLALPVVEEI